MVPEESMAIIRGKLISRTLSDHLIVRPAIFTPI